MRRYGRQILLPQVGGAGQRRLLAAHVCVVAGDGSEARAAATYLAAAGVGRLTLVGEPAVGVMFWGETALRRLNPDVLVGVASEPPTDVHVVDLRGAPSSTPAESMMAGADAALSCLRRLLDRQEES